ncbi:MAG: septum formation initiator [Bacteroidetes bacterium MED-G13]|nr:septum formation initiator [Flavobacteriaceae bacterium]PDH46247.1 MAG: septum formation initiator [Bacteroidetes bacterium MED-G13]|tara:strand:- start:1073 stop:1369 length:297 start_codon:yes stop_codon:yes gene_type:complete
MISKILNLLKKTYVIIILFFVIWMTFFDTNSLLMHFELNQKIKKLKNQKIYYQNEIKKDRTSINEIESDSGIEKYAREKLFMKKENEEIFLIEFDTLD